MTKCQKYLRLLSLIQHDLLIEAVDTSALAIRSDIHASQRAYRPSDEPRAHGGAGVLRNFPLRHYGRAAAISTVLLGL